GFWFFGGLLLLSIGNTFPPRHQHLIVIIPAMSIMTAIGILACADWLGLQMHRARLPGAIAGAVFVVLLISGLWNYFVVMPGVYPPDLENVIAFNTLEQTRPRHVVFVSSDPERKSFVPLLLQNLPYRSTYHTVA